MRLRSSIIGLFIACGFMLSGCGASGAQNATQQLTHSKSATDVSSGAITVNDQTPKTADSLEVDQSSGSALKTSLTASGTVLMGETKTAHRLTIFLDYDCVYCRQFVMTDLPWIERTYLGGKLHVERVFVPMTDAGTFSASLAICAAAQGKFTNADRWLASHAVAGNGDIPRFVKATDIKTATLQTCLKNKHLLDGNLARAAEEGVDRVPFFALDQDRWLGLLTREELAGRIERALR